MQGLVAPNILWRKNKFGFEAPDASWIGEVCGTMEAAVRQSTAADHARAAAIHAELGEAVTMNDAARFQRVSREFHEALLAPCRMPRLLHMLDIAWNVTEPVQTMMRVTGEDRDAMRQDHEEMLAAFVARDADRLKAVAELHHQRLTACITSLSDAPS